VPPFNDKQQFVPPMEQMRLEDERKVEVARDRVADEFDYWMLALSKGLYDGDVPVTAATLAAASLKLQG